MHAGARGQWLEIAQRAQMRQSFLAQVRVTIHAQRLQTRHRPNADVYACDWVSVVPVRGVGECAECPVLTRDREQTPSRSSLVSGVCVVSECGLCTGGANMAKGTSLVAMVVAVVEVVAVVAVVLGRSWNPLRTRCPHRLRFRTESNPSVPLPCQGRAMP